MSETVKYIIVAIAGYLLGSISVGLILSKLTHGPDLHAVGSGSTGASNVLRTMGTKYGLLTFAGDCLKCVAAIVLVRILFGKSHADMMPLLVMYAAAGVILGHDFPFYLGFRGGKGIAATAGLVFSFDPIMTVLGIITFFGTFFLTHYVSLGSLLVYVGIVIEMIVLGQMGHFHMTQPLLIEMYIITIALAALAFRQHRKNIQRLLAGTERKTYLHSSNNQKE